MSTDNQDPSRQFQPSEAPNRQTARILPYNPDTGAGSGQRPSAGSDWLPPPQAELANPAHAKWTPEAPPRRTGQSACLVMASTMALLALSCVVLGIAALQGGLAGLNKLTGLVPSLGVNFAITPTVTIDTSRPSVIEQVRSLSKLETVHYDLEKVITGKSSGPLFDFLTSDKILLVAHGEVVAGVDLSGLTAQDIRVAGQQVTIRLPKPDILYSKLDNDKTYVYDRQTGLLSKPDANLESRMRVAAEQEIVQAAKEDGILSKAQDNARQTIRTLVQGMGYGEVRFEEEP